MVRTSVVLDLVLQVDQSERRWEVHLPEGIAAESRRVAKDLRARGVKGLGVSLLRLTRRFFELYPQIRQSAVAESVAMGGLQIRQSLITESAVLEKGQPVAGESGQRLPSLLTASKVSEFSWTHIIELVRLDDPWKRAFYENECLKGI